MKKLVFWTIFSFLFIGTLSYLLYQSRTSLQNNVDSIKVYQRLHIDLHELLAAVNKLETANNKFISTHSVTDSIKSVELIEKINEKLENYKSSLYEEIGMKGTADSLYNIISKILNDLCDLNFSHSSLAANNIKHLQEREKLFERLYRHIDNVNDLFETKNLENLTTYQNNTNRNYFFFYVLISGYFLLMTIFFVISYIDFNIRKKLNLELENTSKKLKTILDTAPNLIFVKDSEKKFTMINRSFLEFFNISDESDIISKDNSAIIDGNDFQKANSEDEKVLRGGLVLKNIEREVTKNNKEKNWLNINKAPLYDEGGNITGIVGVMNDITKKIEAENLLKELNLQKDKFFSIIAHDLKNPFTTLLGYSDFLVTEYDELSEVEKKEYIHSIRDAIQNLLSLLTNLLTWARAQFNKIDIMPNEFKLSPLVANIIDSISLTAKIKNIELKNNLSESTCVYADEDMVETVIRNLVSNAIKFTPLEGAIVIDAIDAGENVLINVKDNGIGMDSEMITKLFRLDVRIQRDGTANEAGTGLGLLICREFVEKNGGSIEVKSSVNKGTTFSFTLPKEQNNL